MTAARPGEAARKPAGQDNRFGGYAGATGDSRG